MEKENIKIKLATKKDLKEIAKIFWIESAKLPYNKKRKLEKVEKIIKNDFKSSDVYVFCFDREIIGFVILQKDSGIKTKLWLNELWITEKYQAKGIGRKIMNYLENLYSKKGIKEIELVADTDKGGAYGFYKKIGYSVDKKLVFMKKYLR